MGDEDGRAGLEQDVERRLDLRLGLQVEVRGRLVEHEHPGVGQERPGEREQLALAGGQGLAPLLNDRVQAAGQALDELDEPDGADRLVHVVVAGVRAGKRDVVPDRPGEQERLLGHYAELVPQRRQGHRAKVVAVDEDSPAVGS